MWPEPTRTLLPSVAAIHLSVVNYLVRAFPYATRTGFHAPRRVVDSRKKSPSALLVLQLRSARSVVCVLPPIATSYAFAAFSAETQLARSPLVIARAIISGKASGVQAYDGIPIAARLPATSWL